MGRAFGVVRIEVAYERLQAARVEHRGRFAEKRRANVALTGSYGNANAQTLALECVGRVGRVRLEGNQIRVSADLG